MNKIIIFFVLILCQLNLIANSTQVFISNTMQIELDSDTVYEKVFLGTKEDFYKESESLYNSKLIQESAVASSMSVIAAAGANQSFSKLDMNGGLIGAGLIIGVVGSIKTYEYIVADNEYVYVSTATNSKGEKTLVYGLIISNYSLNDSSLEKVIKDKLKGQK